MPTLLQLIHCTVRHPGTHQARCHNDGKVAVLRSKLLDSCEELLGKKIKKKNPKFPLKPHNCNKLTVSVKGN